MSRGLASLAVLEFALCALFSACGTTHAYKGPVRPSEEVALLRCQHDGGDPLLRGLFGNLVDTFGDYVPAQRLDVRIDSVDGRSVAAAQVDLLPGERELTLSAQDPNHWIQLAGMLRFEAVAGREYEVVLVPGQKSRQVFGIQEKGSSTVLANSERSVAEYVPLGEIEWLAGYEIADATDRVSTVSVSWLPRGQTASEWRELLEVSRAPHADPGEAWPNNPAWRERWLEESTQRFRERTLRASGKDWMAFGYSRKASAPEAACHGVGVWRVRGEVQYLLCYERRAAELASAELDLWQKRLVEAPLR
jgi:hypothetical protein